MCAGVADHEARAAAGEVRAGGVRRTVHPRTPIAAVRAPIERRAIDAEPVAGSRQKEVVTKHSASPFTGPSARNIGYGVIVKNTLPFGISRYAVAGRAIF